MHDRAGEAVVGDDEVAAAAQDQGLLAGLIGLAHGADQLVVGRRLDEAARRAAEPQRGVAGEVHLLAEHGHQARRTVALARVRTFSPAERAVSATTTALSSSLSSTLPEITISAPSSSGTMTMEENRTP